LIRTKRIWANEYFKAAFSILMIVVVVFGFFFALRIILNTDSPLTTVETGSMCVTHGAFCDGWSHPFDQTIHVGDILIVQGVDAKELNANYPYSDIIVFRRPGASPDSTPIVHRIVTKQEINGTLYFQTKGDSNGVHWPNIPPASQYDATPDGLGVPEDLIIGRVAFRIPWLGNIALIMNPQKNPIGLPIVVALIIILVIIEFVIPLTKPKKDSEQQIQTNQPA
jgi:signal peptidase I